MRGRVYRWGADRKVSWCEVGMDRLLAEKDWLAMEVYNYQHRPRALGPALIAMTAKERCG